MSSSTRPQPARNALDLSPIGTLLFCDAAAYRNGGIRAIFFGEPGRVSGRVAPCELASLAPALNRARLAGFRAREFPLGGFSASAILRDSELARLPKIRRTGSWGRRRGA